jgi:hypothetical protein
MTLDTKFAAQVRAQLVDTAAGRSPLAKRTRRTRIAIGAVSATAAAALLTAGALVVAGVFIPGQHVITGMGPSVTQQHVGTADVDLGPRPEGANAVKATLTCTSAGRISVDDGFTTCDPDAPTEYLVGDELPDEPLAPIGSKFYIHDLLLPDGSTSFTVTADEGMTWTVTARYVHTETTEWGVNANGQTYGTPNENGMPDLQAAQATNGKIGYIYFDDLMPTDPALQGDHDIPVYESDGVTQIGVFHLGNS